MKTRLIATAVEKALYETFGTPETVELLELFHEEDSLAQGDSITTLVVCDWTHQADGALRALFQPNTFRRKGMLITMSGISDRFVASGD